ncbi:P-loop containing nucleoside triphosphate hydrolase protein [Atractiella rhizophila]|nr:P-loop containing nucleoside triphosphate hydrolase protein [Atractiella rhizophila]
MDEDEVDPLEAFMSTVTSEVATINAADAARLSTTNGSHHVQRSVKREEEDAEGGGGEEEVEEVDELEKVGLGPADILALAQKKAAKGKKEIGVVDHASIKYEPFRKAFYVPPPEVMEMTEEQADFIRMELDSIKIRGVDCPKPVTKWSWCGLPVSCTDVIRSLNYTSPTPIQAQAIPAIMSGRDVIGVAKTGSGKTIAFLLPMFRHIKDQRPIETMEGPISMIMTPTRELATQIYKECKPFMKAMGLRAACAYGGSPLKDNIADMKRGAEILVCTPGRMIELLTTNSGRLINLRRVTYLVLDEADRMFDMGFEPQVMKIVGQIRPDRQTVLFSATFPKQMEALARKILRKPLEITVGGRSVVADTIEQIVEVRDETTKFNRLLQILGKTYNEDEDARTLIFVDRQESADNLLKDLLRKNYVCMSIHGGKDQVDRDAAITDFKSGVVPILTATSVAARGLDVKQLKLVINYDCPNHMEDYVHRAGRTGRAGNKGTCYTFITKEQERYAVDIMRAMQASGATVPDDLKAMADAFLEKVKSGKALAAGSGFGGKGLDRLDKERDAKARAERSAYGENTEDDQGKEETKFDVPDFKVEIKKGPATVESGSGLFGSGSPSTSTPTAAQQKFVTFSSSFRADLIKSCRAMTATERAQAVAAKLNAALRAKTAAKHAEADSVLGIDPMRRRDPDATDYHAIVPINDYPQKARWKVTNKETMVQLIEDTGASVTNKGVYYPPGKEPAYGEQPKLHLLIESNEEFRVKHAISEIKRLLLEASTAAFEAESRNPGQAMGRYSVI